MTRRDRVRPEPSISAYRPAGQPSAWPRDIAYGGGIGLAALVMGLGFTILRPRSRRRSPPVPAPSFMRDQLWRR
jgi:hypothetical protein